MKKNHPYSKLPLHSYWSKGVSRINLEDIDPMVGNYFEINKNHKVATAGSCFAQHIARFLKGNGFNYFVAEPAHELIPLDLVYQYNYGTFSARFGNIYTVRQLLQLFKRAFSITASSEEVWRNEHGGWVDPMRPLIQPNGFSSLRELQLDRLQHLACVKRMFEEMDVFVFTMGLTEAWLSTANGEVYPMCPGVAGGEFSEEKYYFKNFTLMEVLEDFDELMELLKKVNKNVKIILTVSPVPLAATGTKEHIINATSYSKSLLRVAAQELTVKHKNITYFSSYEIITGNFTRGQYFSEDLRSVNEEGVEHVMRVFMKHFADGVEAIMPATNQQEYLRAFESKNAKAAQVVCDEAKYDHDQ